MSIDLKPVYWYWYRSKTGIQVYWSIGILFQTMFLFLVILFVINLYAQSNTEKCMLF